MNYQEMATKIIQKAKEKGYDENLFFVATFSDYQRVRKNIQKIGNEIEAQGVIIKGVVNPLVSEYNKSIQSAAVLAEKLLKMLGENPKDTRKGAGESSDVKGSAVCPDFEMLSPAKLNAWCRHYDIDPNDYSKRFLFKALEKRWKFEYED